MWNRSALFLILLLTACSGMNIGDEQRSVAQAVEPSLRAAAAAAEANRDYKGAVQHLTTLYQRRDDDRDIGVALARNLRYGGQAQQAADVMQGQLIRFPRDADTLVELGKDYLAADRLGLSVKSLEQALGVAPNRWDAHAALAVALDAQGRGAEALAAYGRALELSPDNPMVLNNLALSQALAGKLDEALATMTRAADLPAATAQIRQNLALLLALKGDSAQAEKLVRQDLPADMARTNADILRALAAGAKRQ
ncbi:pilus assembly protein TadD [Paramagnetospirillum kuznetsovii]|uniref:Pilus assembly protein TadD n=1 Tax=Paramagnetospirillum kuznetsovii TaxID=2053833 RepID=A0A364NVN1_9PROT|nr:tetratricopeptide repeat protein [Paramagnetospirillum kuznetsovii]RAU21138.1 pilus assembly protein TadD [Paramagnetospirillum kuznetsovii]